MNRQPTIPEILALLGQRDVTIHMLEQEVARLTQELEAATVSGKGKKSQLKEVADAKPV